MLKIPYFFLLHLRTEYPPMRLVAGQHAALSRYLTFPVTILTERHNNPRSYHSNIHPSSSRRYSQGNGQLILFLKFRGETSFEHHLSVFNCSAKYEN